MGPRITTNFDKKLLGTGLALVAVGLIMAKASRSNRFCRFLARQIAFTGSARFIEAFFV